MKPASQSDLLRAAVRLQIVTIIWMIIEGAVAIGAGIVAGSLLLVAFGIDSAIELSSAVIVFWRFRLELRPKVDTAGRIDEVEEKTARIAGYLLFLLSAYVLGQGVYGLATHRAAEISIVGIVIAGIAAVAMPLLSRAKMRLAGRIRSRSLRADAMEALTCGYLAWVLLTGLAINALTNWWWVDSVASLAIVPILIREGREAVAGEHG